MNEIFNNSSAALHPSASRTGPAGGFSHPPGPASCLDQNPLHTLVSGPARCSLYSSGGERISVVEPSHGAARANIVWVHGLTDHAARQFDSAVQLADAGFRTILFDLQGHGARESTIEESWRFKNAYLRGGGQPEAVRGMLREGDPDPRQHGAQIRQSQYNSLLQTTLDDHFRQFQHVFTRLLSSRWAALPLFLFGHSMGGLICVEAIRRFRLCSHSQLAGTVLMAPGFQPMARPGRRAEQALLDGYWKLSAYTSPFSLVRQAGRQLLNLNFAIDVSWGTRYVSDQEAENDLVDADPLCHRFLPSAYVASIEAQMVRTGRIRPDYLPATLLLLPQDDAIVNTAGSLAFAQRTRQARGPASISVARFRGLRAHHLLRSSQRAQVRHAMTDWMDAQLRRVRG